MAKGIKTGGRQKGTPNKLTFQTRQVLLNMLAEEYENLPELIEKLEPAQRIDVILKLSKFVLPPMMSVGAAFAERKSLENPDIAQQEIMKINDIVNI